MRLKGEIVDVGQLTSSDKIRMVEILSRYFDNISRSNFDADMDRKDQVILLRDFHTGALQGFSTLQVTTSMVNGQRVRSVFSGDTILERDYWQDLESSRMFLKAMTDLKNCSQDPLYWFLICMGYRTYRFLPIYFKEFFPRFDAKTPPMEKMILDHLATERFKTCYDSATGLIHLPEPRSCLKPEFAEVGQGRLNNPHIRFFIEHNSGFQDGMELACLARFDENNLNPIAFRVMGREDKGC